MRPRRDRILTRRHLRMRTVTPRSRASCREKLQRAHSRSSQGTASQESESGASADGGGIDRLSWTGATADAWWGGGGVGRMMMRRTRPLRVRSARALMARGLRPIASSARSRERHGLRSKANRQGAPRSEHASAASRSGLEADSCDYEREEARLCQFATVRVPQRYHDASGGLFMRTVQGSLARYFK